MSKKTDPKVAKAVMLKAGLEPLEPYTNAKTKWKSKCLKCGSVVNPRYNDIQGGKGGCIGCARRLSSDNQRMDEKKAIKVMLNANLQPLEPYKLSRTPWKCRCFICETIVYPSCNNVLSGKSGCNKCGENKSAEKQRKPQQEAISKMLEANFQPVEAYIKSNKAWKSKCLTCQNITSPTLSDVLRGRGCKWCAGNKIDEESAVAFMISKGFQPQVPYSGTHKRWKCIHLDCGTVVYPQFTNIQSGHGGCKKCRAFSINLKNASYVYLITNEELNAHKIGVGNVKKVRDRREQFNLKGWNTHKVWQLETGLEALVIEEEVFRIIRHDLGLPIYLAKEQMGWLRGETETVDADSISLLQLEKIINKVIKGLQK